MSVRFLLNWCNNDAAALKLVANRAADAAHILATTAGVTRIAGSAASSGLDAVGVDLVHGVWEWEVSQKNGAPPGSNILMVQKEKDVEEMEAMADQCMNDFRNITNEQEVSDFAGKVDRLGEFHRQQYVHSKREARELNYKSSNQTDWLNTAKVGGLPTAATTYLDVDCENIKPPSSSPPPPPPSSFFESSEIFERYQESKYNVRYEETETDCESIISHDSRVSTAIFGVPEPDALRQSFRFCPQQSQFRPSLQGQEQKQNISENANSMKATFSRENKRSGENFQIQEDQIIDQIRHREFLKYVTLWEFENWKKTVRRMRNLYVANPPSNFLSGLAVSSSSSVKIDVSATESTGSSGTFVNDLNGHERASECMPIAMKNELDDAEVRGAGAGPFGGDYDNESTAGSNVGALKKMFRVLGDQAAGSFAKIGKLPRLGTKQDNVLSDEEFHWEEDNIEECKTPGDVVTASMLVVTDVHGRIVNLSIYPRRL
ncbi:hypothetical protein HDU82_004337 [Entophlyctis luteolus]|nr:hypothetical protein HDU82_004337 [Entophlyctis luteolus]